MNDLPANLMNSHLLMFADDMKIYKTICSLNGCSDLQRVSKSFMSGLVTDAGDLIVTIVL